MKSNKGFSLVELLVVVVIIGILSTVSYVAIQRAKARALNERMLDDLIMIANSLEDFRRDHGDFPVPTPGGGENQNILCFYEDATYAHDCDPAEGAVFRQGMIDNALLSKRYLRRVPTDPRTGSRYVYGVTNDGKFFQVAGIYENGDGEYEARLAGNLEKGFYLPSVIRAFDGPNFVVEKGTYLPYNPDHMVLVATLENINGQVEVIAEVIASDPVTAYNGMVVYEGQTVSTNTAIPGSSVDIYFSDGSFTHLDDDTELELKSMEVEENDSDSTTTKILLHLKLGKIWSKVVRLASASEFRVETTNSIAGVRGTEFGIDVNGNITLKSGDVWGKILPTDLPPDPEDYAEALFSIPTPPDLDPSYVTDIAPKDLYEQYYVHVPLTTNMTPYVLLAEGSSGTISVRNINYYVDKVDKDQKLTIGLDRSVQVKRLAAYADKKATSLLSEKDISAELTDLHELTNIPLGKPLFLRFEYLNEKGELVNSSGFTQVPALSSDTRMTQYDMYPALFEERPTMRVDAPEFASTGSTFDVTINLEPEGDASYSFAPISGFCSETPLGDNTFTVVASADEDVCEFAATATLESGTELTDTVAIRVIPSTQKLVLDYPQATDYVPAGTVTFRWFTQNPPTPHTFVVSLDGTEISDAGYTQTFITSDSDISLGTHNWKVELLDRWDNVVEHHNITFDVTEDVLVDFTVDDIISVERIINFGDSNGVVSTPDQSVKLQFLANPSDGYTYFWSGTLTFDNPENPDTLSTYNIDTPLPVTHVVNLRVDPIGSVEKTIIIERPSIAGIYFEPNSVSLASAGSNQNITSEISPLMVDVVGRAPFEINPSESCDFSPDITNYTPQVSEDITCNISAGTTLIDAGGAASLEYIVPAGGKSTVLTVSGPTLVKECGDGNIDLPNDAGRNEVCDSANIGGQTCLAQGFDGGTLACAADCLSFDTNGCKTLRVLPPTSIFYQVDTQVPLTIEGISIVSVVPATGSVDAGVFVASAPDTYTLTGDGLTLTLNVCGYTAGGGECWVLGASDQDCTTACVGLGFTCKDSNDVGGEDWDDDGNAACMAINMDDSPTNKGDIGINNPFAPYYLVGPNWCYSRPIDAIDFDDPDTPVPTIETLCTTKRNMDPTIHKRICECEL
jgi:prepilin-type N-terminal cleavage/methylation domain-containing protein